MGSIGSSSNSSTTGSVIPSHSVQDIQNYVDGQDIELKLKVLVQNVYRNLPVVGGEKTIWGMTESHGASIVNGKYLQIDNGPLLQFRRTKNGWKVKEI